MSTIAVCILAFLAIVAIICFHFSFLVAGMGLTAFFFLCLAEEIIDAISNKIKN